VTLVPNGVDTELFTPDRDGKRFRAAPPRRSTHR
jgi:hypothetical protein